MSSKKKTNNKIITIKSKNYFDMTELEQAQHDHEALKNYLIEQGVITNEDALKKLQLKKFVNAIEVENNMLWLPLFYYGNSRLYEMYNEWVDKHGNVCYIQIIGTKEGVLTSFDRDVYIAICIMWDEQGQGTLVKLMWRELAKALNLNYRNNLYRIKKSVEQLQNVDIRVSNAFKVTKDGKMISLDRLNLLQTSMSSKEMKGGILIEFPEAVRINLANNGKQLVDTYMYKQLKKPIHKRLYEFLQVAQFKHVTRTFTLEEIATRIPIYNENQTDVKNTIKKALNKLIECSYLEGYNVIQRGKEGKPSVEIMYGNPMYFTENQQLVNNKNEDNKKAVAIIKTFIHNHNRIIDDSHRAEKESKDTKNHKNTQQQSSNDSIKQYSVEVRQFKEELNEFLEINSLGLELVDYWLKAVSTELLTEFAVKTKEKARDRLGRHGYMVMSVNTYIKNNHIVVQEKEELRKETVVNKEHTKNTRKAQEARKHEDANWYIDTVAYDKDVIIERSVLISLLGEFYFYRLIEAVIKDNSIFGIDKNKQINNDKGMAVLLTSWFIKDNPDVLEVIKRHLIECYPIDTTINEESITQEESTHETTKMKQPKAETNIDNSGKTAVEFCDDEMEEEDDIGYEDDENIVIDIKAKTVNKTEKPIKEKKVKTKVVETVKDIPVSMTIEKPIEFVKMELTGEQLKEARERAGLSTIELGKLIDYDQPTITKWEKGHRTIPKKLIPKIIEVLNI